MSNSFIEVYGSEDVYLKGNPNVSIYGSLLGFISPKSSNSTSSSNDNYNFHTKYDIKKPFRHTNTDYSVVELSSFICLKSMLYTKNLTAELKQYHYLNNLILTFTNPNVNHNKLAVIETIMKQIEYINFNVGGENFKFTSEQLKNYNFYKEQIIFNDTTNDHNSSVIIKLPIPMLGKHSVLPILPELDMELTIAYISSVCSLQPFKVHCYVIEADTEEVMQLQQKMGPYFEDKLSESMVDDNICNNFKLIEMSDFVENPEYLHHEECINRTNLNCNQFPIREIFIKTDTSEEKPMSLIVETKDTIHKKTFANFQMSISNQIANYSKYDNSYKYISLTTHPECTNNIGEISQTNHNIFLETELKITSIITYGICLLRFFYDTKNKKIKCQICKMSKYYKCLELQ